MKRYPMTGWVLAACIAIFWAASEIGSQPGHDEHMKELNIKIEQGKRAMEDLTGKPFRPGVQLENTDTPGDETGDDPEGPPAPPPSILEGSVGKDVTLGIFIGSDIREVKGKLMEVDGKWVRIRVSKRVGRRTETFNEHWDTTGLRFVGEN